MPFRPYSVEPAQQPPQPAQPAVGRFKPFVPQTNIPEPNLPAQAEPEAPSYLDRYKTAGAAADQAIMNKPLTAGPGLVEAATTVGTSIVAPMAGLVDSTLARLGWEDPQNPTGSYATARDKYIYQPRTDTGKAFTGQLGAMFAPVGDALQGASNFVADLIPDETVANDMREMGPDLFGAALGLKASKQVPKVVKTAMDDAPPLTPEPELTGRVKNARTADLKVLPSEAGGGVIARTLEAAGGKPLKEKFAQANEATTSKLTREDTAMGGEINAKNADARVSELAGVYDEMASLGKLKRDAQLDSALAKVRARAGKDMKRDVAIDELVDTYEALADGADAAQVVETIKNKRMDAKANASAPVGEQVKAADKNMADAELALTEALEDWLGRAGETAGKTDLVERFRTARKEIAKTRTAQRATRAGRTSAKDLEKAKQEGAPLAERMGLAADSAEYFPESMADVRPGVAAADVSDSLFGWLKSAGSNAVAPVASKILQSDWYQNRLGTAGDVTKLPDYFDQSPKLAPGDPNVGPPNPPPRVDFAGELGLVPDTGPRDTLPGGNIRGARSDLRLQEDVPPALPGRRTAPSDMIDFEAVTPDKVGPYRLNTDPKLQDVRPPAGTQRGAAVGRSGDLSLEPDFIPGPYDELPPPGSYEPPGGLTLVPDGQGGLTFAPERPPVESNLEFAPYDVPAQMPPPASIVDDLADMFVAQLEPELPPPAPQLALPRPGDVPIRLPDLETVLGLTPDIKAVGRQHPNYAGVPQRAQQAQAQAAPGVQRTVTGFRGGPEGADLLDTSGTHGNALFWAPDQYGPTGAANYGSQVISKELAFNNLLEQQTLAAVRQALGLADNAELLDIINTARQRGYDGVTYDLQPGREYIQIPQ